MTPRTAAMASLAIIALTGCATTDRLPDHRVEAYPYSRPALTAMHQDYLSPVAVTRNGTRLTGGLTIWRDHVCTLEQGVCAPEAEVVGLERRILTGPIRDPNATRPQEVAAYVVFSPVILTAIVLSEAGLWTPYPERSPEDRQRRETQLWRQQATRLVSGCAFHAPEEVAPLQAVLATQFPAPGAAEEELFTRTGAAVIARWQTLGSSCLQVLGTVSGRPGIAIPNEVRWLRRIRERHLLVLCGGDDSPPGVPGAVRMIQFDGAIDGYPHGPMEARARYLDRTAADIERWLADPVTFDYVPETAVACPSAVNPRSDAEARARVAAAHPLNGWQGQDVALSRAVSP